jgi:4-hydroxyphenylpyruvate dioxygenase
MLLHGVCYGHLCIHTLLLFFLQIIFVFKSPLNPGNEGIKDSIIISTVWLFVCISIIKWIIHVVMGAHQTLHGDGVKDIAFSVEDCRALYKVRFYKNSIYTHYMNYEWKTIHLQKALERGAQGVKEPWEESDEHGTVTYATVKTVSSYDNWIMILADWFNYMIVHRLSLIYV